MTKFNRNYTQFADLPDKGKNYCNHFPYINKTQKPIDIMAHFPCEKIQYEGPSSKNPFAFKHYNPEEMVAGKSMKEHLSLRHHTGM